MYHLPIRKVSSVHTLFQILLSWTGLSLFLFLSSSSSQKVGRGHHDVIRQLVVPKQLKMLGPEESHIGKLIKLGIAAVWAISRAPELQNQVDLSSEILNSESQTFTWRVPVNRKPRKVSQLSITWFPPFAPPLFVFYKAISHLWQPVSQHSMPLSNCYCPEQTNHNITESRLRNVQIPQKAHAVSQKTTGSPEVVWRADCQRAGC